jgi:hypothetical protein
MPNYRFFPGCLLAASLVSPAAWADVRISDAYARAVPPGQAISAAFMTLHNAADQAVKLVKAQTPSAESVELHQNSQQDGVMQMRRADRIEIPATSDYVLAPGADHLMLIGLKQPLNSGDRIELELTFSDGQQVHFELPVRSPMQAQDGPHHPDTDPAAGHHHNTDADSAAGHHHQH